MAFQKSLFPASLSLLFNLLSFYVLFTDANVLSDKVSSAEFNRDIFPPDFIFGAGSSAYQIEGAWNLSGKGPSVWDHFTHTSGLIVDGSTGDVAVDFYHRYKEDLELAKLQGLDSFRFSIAWSRILPHGKRSKGINWAGIDFYNRVINETIANGMIPFVTLFHWDPPQALEEKYLSFLDPEIVVDFTDYADICFKYFGDRVKFWTTLNEPYSHSINGYDYGIFAPGRCSPWTYVCQVGDSSIEPYTASHYLLLAHAYATDLYKRVYQPTQKGEIGIVLYSQWAVPYSDKEEDKLAAIRSFDFMIGWFLDPVVFGDYPADMKRMVGARLPKFSPEEKKLLKGSYDYIGLNYYTSFYVSHDPTEIDPKYYRATTDPHLNKTYYRNGIPIGEEIYGCEYNYIVPEGLERLLLYVYRHYNQPVIYVTECGMPEFNITEVDQGINDDQRVRFYEGHLKALHKAFKEGVNVKGFFAWSLHDNFEWFQGYTQRFGIKFIDFENDLKRYAKKSSVWLQKFLLKDSSTNYISSE